MAFGTVEITAGSGTPVAVDTISSAKYQRVKLVAGGEGGTANLGHAEDAAHTSGDGGIMALGVRSDSAASLAGTDGDYTSFIFNATGHLWTAAVQSGTWNITNISGTISLPTGAATSAKQDTAQTALDAIKVAVELIDNGISGNEFQVDVVTMPTVTVQDGGGSLTVDGTVAATQSGTWTVTGSGGTFPVTDSGGSLTVDAPVGTPVFVRLSDGSSAIATLPVSLATVPSHAVTNAGTFAVQAASAGDTADDAADSGNPVKVGTKVETAPSGNTALSDGDRADMLSDSDRLLLTKPYASGADQLSEAVSNTDGASTAFTNFAAVANVKNVITAITAFRTDAGSSMAYIDFRDGTAGSVLFRVPLPPAGGVALSCGGFPLFKTTANTALAFDVSSALSTVYISVAGYKSRL